MPRAASSTVDDFMVYEPPRFYAAKYATYLYTQRAVSRYGAIRQCASLGYFRPISPKSHGWVAPFFADDYFPSAHNYNKRFRVQYGGTKTDFDSRDFAAFQGRECGDGRWH